MQFYKSQEHISENFMNEKNSYFHYAHEASNIPSFSKKMEKLHIKV